MFLLDTCVVSESAKKKRDDGVMRWLADQHTPDLYISAVTAGELRYGVSRMTLGREMNRLHEWLLDALNRGFAGRILPFDHIVADRWGQLRADYPNAEVADSQIAATTLVHGLTLVTRNVRDFDFQGLAVFNPWSK